MAQDIEEFQNESKPTVEKEILYYKWQEMPDIEEGYIPELGYR